MKNDLSLENHQQPLQHSKVNTMKEYLRYLWISIFSLPLMIVLIYLLTRFGIWLHSEKQLLNLVVTLSSVTLGIPAGFHVNRMYGKWKDKYDKRILLNSLINSMKSNEDYSKQVVDQLEKSNPPSFLMDISVLDHATQSRMNLFDADLFEYTNKIHFELLHLNNRIVFTLNCISHNAENDFTKGVMSGAQQLAESVVERCVKTKSKLQCELKKT